MNDTVLADRRNNLAQLFERHSFRDDTVVGKPSEVSIDGVPQSLDQLSLFPLLRQQVKNQSKISTIQKSHEVSFLIKDCHEFRKVYSKIEKHIDEISKCLDFLCAYSQDIEHVLTSPKMKDALPLPHLLHRTAISLVEACSWLLRNRNWHPADCDANWDMAIRKLQKEIEERKSLAMHMDRNLQDNTFLRNKINVLLNNLHRL